jgi:hypothetical protein
VNFKLHQPIGYRGYSRFNPLPDTRTVRRSHSP